MSTTKIDPLALMKECYTNGLPAKLSRDLLTFKGKYNLKFTTPTAWRRDEQGNQYTVGDLWLFLECEKNGEPISTYYTRSLEFQSQFPVNMIAIEHTRDIRDYFFGRISSSQYIDNALREVVETERKESSSRVAISIDLLDDPSSFSHIDPAANAENLDSLEMLRKWERGGESRLARLRSAKNFGFCVEIMARAQKLEAARTDRKVVGSPKSVLSRVLGLNSGSLEESVPIILVPSEKLPGNLCLSNAESFLARGVYDPNPPRRDAPFQFETEVLDRKIAFEVWDDINTLRSKKKLASVVAVFISGDPYQFKDIERSWEEPSIARLFKRVRAYLLQYKDAVANPTVKQWNVKHLKLDRNSRHTDIAVHRDFLEDFRNFLLSTYA